MRGFASSFNPLHVSGFNIHSGIANESYPKFERLQRRTAGAVSFEPAGLWLHNAGDIDSRSLQIQIMSSMGMLYSTVSLPICSMEELTCAQFKSCWATPTLLIQLFVCIF